MIKVAVCDDDSEIAEELKAFLTAYGKAHDTAFSIFCYSDGDELMLSEQKYDLIFLDIEMERVNGFDAASQIRAKDMNVPIVYITSHNGYFERAFKVHAFEYITKPLERDRLSEVMNDFFALNRSSDDVALQVCTDGGFISVRLNDIYCFTAEAKKKVYLYTGSEKLVIRENLQDIYDKLDKTQFYMPKRGFILNLKYVQRLQNDYVIVMKNGIYLPLAQKKKDEFNKKLSSVFLDKLKG